uniref:TATA-binding protein interacting (TIP20) domain-containing protein n=1 Tax=Cyclophora tenuis TaxID=216820 RepID=A0A7S1D7C7_CYCTE|mmetsp:Transcript_24791/g.42191  ORF Transcript_24791/g.42191 Transcript_24791/m.42191 type:complete len:144 (+) Transcript_24791:1-432(+)
MRKSAMSIFATCLEKQPGSLDLATFMPVLAKALADLEDVQLQAHQIVVTMSQRHPTYLVAAVDDFVPAFETMFMDKTIKRKTANKTGTELERAKEWIKSGLRALLAMSRLEGVLNNRRFSTLVDRVKGDQKFRPMLDAVEDER